MLYVNGISVKLEKKRKKFWNPQKSPLTNEQPPRSEAGRWGWRPRRLGWTCGPAGVGRGWPRWPKEGRVNGKGSSEIIQSGMSNDTDRNREGLSNTVAERKTPNVEAAKVLLPRTGACCGAGMAYWASLCPELIIWKDTCTPTFIAALLTTAKIWKQPKCPSTDEWIKKTWYIYTMEYYSAIKKNEMLPFAATWMDLEGIMLSEISQTEKNKYYMTSLICGI